MTELEWTGEHRFTDHYRSVVADGPGVYEVPDDAVEEYLDHRSGGWQRTGGESSSDSDDSDSNDSADAESSDATEEEDTSDDRDLTDLSGVGDATAEALREVGYGSFDALRDASIEALADVSNLSEDDAESIHDQLNDES